MAERYALVLTTINVPRLLDAYLADFRAHGRDAVEVIVIGDQQTPAEAHGYIDGLRRAGAPVELFDLARQAEALARFPALAALLPTRSIQRRNVGYLIAFERGADVIISMDDDNFLLSPDYLAGHAHVGQRRTLPCVASADGWLNVCDWLETAPPRRFYHRGYPISRRWHDAPLTPSTREATVAVNAGLWLGDPDVDTVTRLEQPFQVTAHRAPAPHMALARGTWSPFNSQNTAAIAELLPFLYLVVAGQGLRAYRSDLRNFRYDDIWMSYVALKAIDHMDHAVTFGAPLVEQRRNPHNLLHDLDRELVPMTLTEPLLEMLAAITLRGSDYLTLYAEVIDGLRAQAARHERLDARERQFFADVLDGMQAWHQACALVMKR